MIHGNMFVGNRRHSWCTQSLSTPSSSRKILASSSKHCGSAGKESACSAGDLGQIPELGRSSGERKGYPLQYSGLENSIDCIVHGVTKSWTRLSNFHFTSLHFRHSIDRRKGILIHLKELRKQLTKKFYIFKLHQNGNCSFPQNVCCLPKITI